MRKVNANSHLNGAALISSDGKEVAITESMMQRAFEQFEKSSNFYPSSLMLQAKAFKKQQRQRPFQLRLV
jgi:hypothetical protein